jgi:phenylacetate-CoA ligase
MKWFELFLKFSGYDLQQAAARLIEIHKRIDETGMKKYHQEQLWQILEWHYLNNPSYQKHLNGRKPQTWSEVKPIRKSDYQSGLDNWISIPYRNKKKYISSTSGSSGHPFWFAKDKECHALTWASVKRFYGSLGLSLSSKQARFYGIPISGTGRYKEKLKDLLMNRVRFHVFDLSDENLNFYVQRFKKYNFDYIYGYTSALVQFAHYCIRNNIQLSAICPSLKCCIYTSESIGPGEADLLKQAFGVRAFSEYGASETGIIAFENEDGKLWIDEGLIYLEQHTNEDGSQTTLITSLYNKAFPIIKYDIGDILSLKVENEKTYIETIEGRTNDVILLPGGKKAAGLTFYYISRSILEKSGALKEFIIKQKATDHFLFEIVSDRPLTATEEHLIRKETKKYLMDGLEVEFAYRESIPRLKSGKIKHFISEL